MYIPNGINTNGIKTNYLTATNGNISKLTTNYSNILQLYTCGINLSGEMVITGNISLSGNISVNNLNVSGNVEIQKNLTVSGNTSLRTLEVSEKLEVLSYTESSSTDTGALVVFGGVGIGKNLNVGGNVNVNGQLSMTSNILSNRRIITTYLNLTDLSGIRNSVIYNTGNYMTYDNNVLGGSHLFAVSDLSGTQTSPIIIRSEDTLMFNPLKMVASDPADRSIYMTYLNLTDLSGVSTSVIYNTGNYMTYDNNVLGGGHLFAVSDISGNQTGPFRITSNEILMEIPITTITGVTNITNGTNSTSSTSGALVVTGGVGIGKDVFIEGNIYASNLSMPSDYRIKSDIQSLDSSYSVDKLNPIKYKNLKTNNIDIGFLAHELQDVYPFLVNGIKDGENLQSVNYIGLIGILVNEIKSLKNRIDTLESNFHN